MSGNEFFSIKRKGYDKDEVTAFIEKQNYEIEKLKDSSREQNTELSEKCETLENENKRLNEKIEELQAELLNNKATEKIEKNDEQLKYGELCLAVGDKLLAADKRSEEIIFAAEKEAEKIINEAKAKGDILAAEIAEKARIRAEAVEEIILMFKDKQNKIDDTLDLALGQLNVLLASIRRQNNTDKNVVKEVL